METPSRVPDAAVDGDEYPSDAPDATITVHRTSPDRAVFTERGNTDGWIATDLAVELER